MAGNRLFGHQGLLARSRRIVVKHGSALPPKLLIGKVSGIDNRPPLVRRPLSRGRLTHEAKKRLPCYPFFLVGSARTHRP
jgi:hypothetical protein